MKIFHTILFLLFSFSLWSQSVDKTDLNLLTAALNSAHDEQNPVLHPDGQTLYFTRANDSLNAGGGKDKGDIWKSVLNESGRWSAPVPLSGALNDALKNSMLGFSPDGNLMFLNQEYRHPGGLVSNQGIAYAQRSAGTWSAPKKATLDYFVNSSSHQSGSISADGRVMLLSLQAYASRGAEDIYVSFYNNGHWGQPINLGSDINTSDQEMTPYLAADGKTLYFSSNGHGGKGGRDLYVSTRQDDTWKNWSKPKNLGDINSNGVDYYYFIDYTNEIAYYVTTQNSDGYGDIKAIDISVEARPDSALVAADYTALTEEPEPAPADQPKVLQGKVRNANTGEPVPAAVQVRTPGAFDNLNADPQDGSFNSSLPADLSTVEVAVKAPGYMSAEESVQLSEPVTSYTFDLTPLVVGSLFRLNKVYFERGTASLIDSSFAELDRLSEVLSENPTIEIELAGHTDNQGSSRLNLRLSRDRVEEVKKYLVEKGIEEARIEGKGYGGTRPVASNAGEQTRKLNRRVEIVITKE
jgi:outer membrane protein OmpA-like peptidoglycan-associated protein